MTVIGIQCKHCSDIIVSEHRHDYKKCKCGKVGVDGGRDMLKVSFPDGEPEDHCEVVEIDRNFNPETR